MPASLPGADQYEFTMHADGDSEREIHLTLIPFALRPTAEASYGRVAAAVIAAGRKARRRFADLMIAATAMVEELPLFTTNPDDYLGLEKLLTGPNFLSAPPPASSSRSIGFGSGAGISTWPLVGAVANGAMSGSSDCSVGGVLF